MADVMFIILPWNLVAFRAEMAVAACSAVMRVTKAIPICLFSLAVGILFSVSYPNFANSASMSFLEVECSRFRTRILPGSQAVLVLSSMVPWWFLLGVPFVVPSLWMPTS